MDQYSTIKRYQLMKVRLRSFVIGQSQRADKALIIQDVKDAVATGKIVTISQSTIRYKGWLHV
jgi:hypothetical protein